ncbi:MAG: DUF421 domain-containing protein [Oscillospiraceae bacterium]|nr:DUF421 domain-containing protein [Oscillospiraceae bacterium]MBQ9695679.1 DUF421 domain-containing protein [Oscillospiraceae bacterium]MBR1458845.1 DUF421 domain-containing protein [Oscillospiraceae bacterium]
MTIILIRTWILYAVVIFSVRLMGKRQLGELQPSELVITILVSNIATLSLEDTEIPLLHGILPILLLVCFEVLVSWLTLKSVRMRRLVSGSPQVIIRGGVIDQQKLHELRFSLDDLMTSLRTAGIFSASEVQYAVVETNGTVSVMQKPAYQPAEKGDVGAASPAADPPQMLVADGQLREEALQALGRDKAWLESLLHGAGIRLQEVFLLTADRDGVRTLTRKGAAA